MFGLSDEDGEMGKRRERREREREPTLV
jgi:hypothetical protein